MTIFVRRWAIRRGFVDQPSNDRIHDKAVPLGGGIVIFTITMLPLAVVSVSALLLNNIDPAPTWLGRSITTHLPGLATKACPLLLLIAAVAVLHITGLIDDKRHLGPGIKLLVQFAVATFLAVFADIRFHFFIQNIFVTTILSVLWMVIIINAFNFLDNMDGLSACIAVICSTIILGAAWSSGQVFVSAFLAILIGALLGFLVFNFAPAKIFMGDAGSQITGLMVAIATIGTTYYQAESPTNSWFATLMPLIVLAVPLYDFLSVTVIRLIQGKSPFVGDTQHFSHRLVKRGMSQRQAVLTIYIATACTGLGATILHQVTTLGMILIFIQTILIVLIIAILEINFRKF